jgi:crotonobetainyl-CoA:carnitine CoA-transferase CaiB-like acyl-CoA transferase
MRPLEGFRIIDLTHALAGPFCTYQLAMLGAEIIKIENPGVGDDFRGMSKVTFDSVNSGKKSVTLNLKNPDALPVLARLCENADVLVDNFRPGTAEKFGITWDKVQQWKRELIWCSISGFGLDGPWRGKPAVEWSVQAASGLSDSYLFEDTDPRDLGLGILDLSTGHAAATSILAALLQRHRSGAGQRIDVAMLDVALSLMATRVPVKGPSAFGRRPAVGRFKARDRRLFLMGAHQRWFAAISNVLGAPALVDDPRFATAEARQENRDALRGEIERRLAAKSAREWEELLNGVGVPAAEVRELQQVVSSEHVRQRHFLHSVGVSGTDETLQVSGLPYRFVGQQHEPELPVPALGEHTAAVLADAGYSGDEIGALGAAGVV